MRFVIFDDYRPGVVIGDRVHDVSGAFPDWSGEWPHASALKLISTFPQRRSELEAYASDAPSKGYGEVTLRAPLPTTGKIVGAGVNYAGHLAAVGGRPADWPTEGPEVFIKAGSSIIGPDEPIRVPDVTGTDRVVHEPELGVIIGKVARNVSRADAFDYVFGYTGVIDVTMIARGERSRRKSHDTFAPLGPTMVTADEIPNPRDVSIKLWVNGQLLADANTSDMLLGIEDLIEYSSSVMTLYPGDLIITGAPPGVGAIKDGDRVALEVGVIGRMELDVRQTA